MDRSTNCRQGFGGRLRFVIVVDRYVRGRRTTISRKTYDADCPAAGRHHARMVVVMGENRGRLRLGIGAMFRRANTLTQCYLRHAKPLSAVSSTGHKEMDLLGEVHFLFVVGAAF